MIFLQQNPEAGLKNVQAADGSLQIIQRIIRGAGAILSPVAAQKNQKDIIKK